MSVHFLFDIHKVYRWDENLSLIDIERKYPNDYSRPWILTT